MRDQGRLPRGGKYLNETQAGVRHRQVLELVRCREGTAFFQGAERGWVTFTSSSYMKTPPESLRVGSPIPWPGVLTVCPPWEAISSCLSKQQLHLKEVSRPLSSEQGWMGICGPNPLLVHMPCCFLRSESMMLAPHLIAQKEGNHVPSI